MPELTKKERGCWAVWAYAPPGTSLSDANAAFNAYVDDDARGLALFHDHFADRAGGVALFAVESAAERDALRTPGPLEGWDLRVHPLIFSAGDLGFLFQVDFTLKVYRGRRLRPIWEAYAASDLARRNDAR